MKLFKLPTKLSWQSMAILKKGLALALVLGFAAPETHYLERNPSPKPLHYVNSIVIAFEAFGYCLSSDAMKNSLASSKETVPS